MTEAAGVVVIGPWQLALATAFVAVIAGLSLSLSLGVGKQLVIAAARTYVQLFALGFVLRWAFGADNAWLTLGLLLVMISAASITIVRRAPDAPRGILGGSFLSMLVTGLLVTFTVTALIVQVDPWYRVQYVVPIAGMVLGNSMNGVALALERTFADLDAREAEVLALVALGATPWEAARASVRTAIRAGLIPTINSMATVGIVFIPGMMTGQVLAGADPLAATGYQIVVMLMVSAATALGSVMSVMLAYRRRFTAEGVFLERGLRADAR